MTMVYNVVGKKTLCAHIKTILKALWGIFCIIVIITTIVLVSKYTQEASYLRRNETNDYVTNASIFKMSMFQKFLCIFNEISSNNDSNANVLPKYWQTEHGVKVNITGVEIYETNTQYDYDEEVKTCKPLPPKDDFSICGNSIAERKCCEYVWAWKYKDDLMEHSRCNSRDYGIIGGQKVAQGHFPHMVAVGFRRLEKNITTNKYEYSYKCGGSLISELFVLTVAHCTKQVEDHEHEKIPRVVLLGGENIYGDMKPVRIAKIIKNEKYASPKVYYDIALLKLLKEVDFTYNIHPACLSTKFNPQEVVVNVTGWGTIDPNDHNHMTDHLQVATVHIISRFMCKRLLRYKYSRNFKQLVDHHFCAGNFISNVDTCRGDSGGPLQVRLNIPFGNIHRVIGVTSFGTSCATKKPAVYVNVTSFIPWIEKIVWPEHNTDG